MSKDRFGYRGDDEVKYGEDGRFPEVLAFINRKFLPSEITQTKRVWDEYIAGRDAGKYAFGDFAAYLMKDTFSTDKHGDRKFPTREEWFRDAAGYKPMDPVALKAIVGAVRDNLQQAKPTPTIFAVGASTTGKHYVESSPISIEGQFGVLVTLYCPADPGTS